MISNKEDEPKSWKKMKTFDILNKNAIIYLQNKERKRKYNVYIKIRKY